jgi:hypothetical protein
MKNWILTILFLVSGVSANAQSFSFPSYIPATGGSFSGVLTGGTYLGVDKSDLSGGTNININNATTGVLKETLGGSGTQTGFLSANGAGVVTGSTLGTGAFINKGLLLQICDTTTAAYNFPPQSIVTTTLPKTFDPGAIYTQTNGNIKLVVPSGTSNQTYAIYASLIGSGSTSLPAAAAIDLLLNIDGSQLYRHYLSGFYCPTTNVWRMAGTLLLPPLTSGTHNILLQLYCEDTHGFILGGASNDRINIMLFQQ